MKLAVRAACFAASGLLAWYAIASTPADRLVARGTFASRLLGPVASLAAAIEWGRFDAAATDGDEARAWRHADRALLLDPEDAEGWKMLAHHAVFERGSPRRSASPAERRRWVEYGIAILERGEHEAANPGPVAFKLGVVYLALAHQDDGERTLPITRRQAWTLAAEAFDRAAAASEPVAAEAARLAREEAEHAG